MIKKYITRLSYRRLFLSVLITVISLLCFSQLFYRVSIVSDNRMAPTLKKKDVVLVKKKMRLQRFDIVLCQINSQLMFLRIIGLPEEFISYSDDVLYVNGSSLEEPFLINKSVYKHDNNQLYTDSFTLSVFGELNSIPRDEYLLLGDNRPYSNDSRYYGLIHRDDIKGKLVTIIHTK